MNLHARNVAIRAGVPNNLVTPAVSFMRERKDISEKCAVMFLKLQKIKEKELESVADE